MAGEGIDFAGLRHPTSMVIAGASSSGKTLLTLRLMRDACKVFNPPPERCIFVCDSRQPSFQEFEPAVEFVDSLENVQFDHRPSILALDDLMTRVSDHICEWFTKGRHRNVSVIFLTQNVFHEDKRLRTINTNAHHFVFMRSPRAPMQIATLGRQVFGVGKGGVLQRIYEEATRGKPYSYLWLDLSPHTDERARVKSQFLPSDRTDASPYAVVYKF